MSKAPRLSISCGIFLHRIQLSYDDGNGNVLTRDATDSALCAVRDYLVDDMTINKMDSIGYSWTRADGKIVKLICIMEDLSND